MQHPWARRQAHARRITDFVIVLVSSVHAMALVRITRLDATTSIAAEASTASCFALVWFVSLRVRRTFEYRTVGHSKELGPVVVVATLASFVPIDGVRHYLLTALPMGLLLVVGRACWQRCLDAGRVLSPSLPRALIIGSGADIDFVAEQLGRAAACEYVVAGATFSDGLPEANAATFTDFPAFEVIEAVTHAIAIFNDDAVILANNPDEGGEFVRTLSWWLESSTAEFVLAWCLDSVVTSRLRFDAASGMPMTHIVSATFSGGKHHVKSAMDIVLSGFALLVRAPGFGVIALRIRRGGTGSVFFPQQRVGHDAYRVSIIKSRSMVMVVEADLVTPMKQNDGNGILFKLRADPRVTPIGATLRRFSLDELPQICNIFAGDVSIADPRPSRAREIGQNNDCAQRRLFIKPDPAGAWQVGGHVGLGWEESVKARCSLRRELGGLRRYTSHLAHHKCRRQGGGGVSPRCSEAQRGRGRGRLSSPSGYWRARSSLLASFRPRNPECGSTLAGDTGQGWGIW